MADYPKQGEIWWALFYEGWERPSIVVSRNEFNRGRLILVVPCTSSRVARAIRLFESCSHPLRHCRANQRYYSTNPSHSTHRSELFGKKNGEIGNWAAGGNFVSHRLDHWPVRYGSVMNMPSNSKFFLQLHKGLRARSNRILWINKEASRSTWV